MSPVLESPDDFPWADMAQFIAHATKMRLEFSSHFQVRPEKLDHDVMDVGLYTLDVGYIQEVVDTSGVTIRKFRVFEVSLRPYPTQSA